MFVFGWDNDYHYYKIFFRRANKIHVKNGFFKLNLKNYFMPTHSICNYRFAETVEAGFGYVTEMDGVKLFRKQTFHVV